MFDIHDAVAAVAFTTYEGRNVTLDGVCFKPFGDACAIESVAQYWQLDRAAFEAGRTSVQQCLSHWSTSCRCGVLSQHLVCEDLRYLFHCVVGAMCPISTVKSHMHPRRSA